jgi:hypothetical protein
VGGAVSVGGGGMGAMSGGAGTAGDTSASGGTSSGSGGTSSGSGGTSSSSGGTSSGNGGTSSGNGGTSSGGAAGNGGSAGVGGSAAGGGGSPATCQEGATQLCCQGGHQTCSGGVWGACTGMRISEETCNGVDDDCNGSVDDLGTVTCGVGACTTTVAACGPNGITTCVPAAPATTVDGCDGIDNDCDGAIDEDCSSCVRVAPNGDDTTAAGDNNATPFATVQAAIDYAAAHPSGPPRVCVAGGATCQDSASYAGPSATALTMRDGIDVYANYEATTWTRCTAPNTHLAPQTEAGVLFPSAVTSPTTLDGFLIDRYTAGTSATAVTVDGATNVVLSNLVVPINTVTVTNAYGFVLQNGAEALVMRSRVEVGKATNEVIGIKAVNSRLYFEDSAGADDNGSAQLCKTSGNGVVVSSGGLTQTALKVRGILLESSPESIVQDSDVCASFVGASPQSDRSAVIEIHGDATGTMIRHNHLSARPYAQPQRATLSATDCGGAAPWIAGNTLLMAADGEILPNSSPEVIYAAGDCHPLIDSNPSISERIGSNAGGTAIHCGSLGGTDSRCIISKNASVGVSVPTYGSSPTSLANGTGIWCEGTSCARIDHNNVWGLQPPFGAMSCAVRMSGTAVALDHSPALVTTNIVVGMNAGGGEPASTGTGMSSAGAARIENNFIYGANTSTLPSSCNGVISSTGLAVSGAADVNSNYVDGWPGVFCSASTGFPSSTVIGAYGVTNSGSGATFRNNVMLGCASFRETGASADPVIFQNNDLLSGYLNEGATFPNPDFSDPRLSPTQVNSLTDMTTGGNIAATCFASSAGAMHLSAGAACIDAGATAGAPTVDYDGQARDATPDIGPDEYVH